MLARWLYQAGIVVLIGILFAGCGSQAEPEASPAGSNPAVSSTDPVATNQVTITTDGFVPQNIRIKKGTKVTWTNSDTVTHTVSSDPHPIHTGLRGFDSVTALTSGQTFSFTFEKVGEWSYHDHLRPISYTGTVIVTE